MRALALLTPGTILHIEDIGGTSRTYKVIEHLKGGYALCKATNKDDAPLQDLDERVTVIYPQNNGVTLILSWIRESRDNGATIILDPVGKMWFVERRRYFRLKGPNVTARYRIIDEETRLDEGAANGLVWDLSGNGIALFIKSKQTIKPKTQIELEIVLPGGEAVEIVGEVIRCAHQIQRRTEYLLGIHFTQIDEADREKIVQYVIQEQLANLKSTFDFRKTAP